MKKGVLIGPFFPYKGGIAQHTGMLYRALEKKYNMTAVSYRLQYPKILYPGKDQFDYTNKDLEVKDAHRILNSINPISWINTARFISKKRPEFIIIQWWHPFLAPMYIGLMTVLRLMTHTKIFIMCHNTLPHEKFPCDKILFKIISRLSHGLIFHSSQEEKKAKSLGNIKKSICFPHPLYEQYAMYQYNAKACKTELKIDEKGILFFGFIREYKGLKYLIDALADIVIKIPDIKLIIAGEFFNNKEQYLEQIKKLKLEKNIVVYDDYIPDNEVGKYFEAAELVVLPYTSATQSGIVATAYGFDRPVVVTDIEGLTEVVCKDKTGYIVPVEDSKALSTAIVDFYEQQRFEEMSSNVREYKKLLSWEEFCNTLERELDI